MKRTIKRVAEWMGTARVLAVPRSYADKFLEYYNSAKGVISFSIYNNPQEPVILDLIREIKREKTATLGDLEFYQIYLAVKRTEGIAGDIAEVGVSTGGSARLICETTKKNVHLFDTFEGLPDISKVDSSKQFKKGEYLARIEDVESYLKKYPNVNFYKGLFPSTSEPVEKKRFSFVHLDVDIYESTLDGLGFFYPRMNKGGVIVSHDYPTARGVKKAFDEFFSDKPEVVIKLQGCDQCLVVKA